MISDVYPRTDRVSPNPFPAQELWSTPETNPEYWSQCHEPDGSVRVVFPGKNTCCRMLPDTWSEELLSCAWCKSWAHYRCTYGIEEGRACASHFLILDPLNKTIIANPRDECVPASWKGKQVFPNCSHPKANRWGIKSPSNTIYALEATRVFKHAWRGVGAFYRKADHIQTYETDNAPLE